MSAELSPETPDFEVTVGDTTAKAVLEWRGQDGAFWGVHVGDRGVFRPAVEMDLKQARAVAALVAEYNRKLGGITADDKAILDLTRQNAVLKNKVEELESEQLNAEIKMRKVGVPSSFEDGNSSDDLSFNEQVGILCDMYQRREAK